MSKKRDELRLLLLQNRENEFIRRDEQRVFAYHCGIKRSQIDILNVFDSPDYPLDILDQYDALLVGGASEVSVSEPEKYPFLVREKELLLSAAEKNIPVFASCFGFQLAVLAFGGEIIKDTQEYEMGTIPVRRTEASNNDPLFQGIPSQFLVVSVHQEKALSVPDNCELLAFTDACCHAFRVKEKPFWAFQFHPEINLETLVSWLTIYSEKYTEDKEHLHRTIEKFTDTPDAHHLLKNFTENVLLKE